LLHHLVVQTRRVHHKDVPLRVRLRIHSDHLFVRVVSDSAHLAELAASLLWIIQRVVVSRLVLVNPVEAFARVGCKHLDLQLWPLHHSEREVDDATGLLQLRVVHERLADSFLKLTRAQVLNIVELVLEGQKDHRVALNLLILLAWCLWLPGLQLTLKALDHLAELSLESALVLNFDKENVDDPAIAVRVN